ncbi:MAG: hypothetical protein AB7L92_01400 [Alphaproteobacteria bacterium]
MACEPCREYWDTEKSAREAKWIIIGTRTSPQEPAERGEGPNAPGGPESIKIQVDSVLKGELGDGPVIAHAWSGMCPYGIVIPPGKPHVIFMTSKEGDVRFHALNYGCAVSAMALQDQQIITRDGPMTMDAFRQMLQ